MRSLVVVAAVVLVCTLTSCRSEIGGARAPVVYGDDDRVEVYEHPSELLRDRARDSVAMQLAASLVDRSQPDAPRIDWTRTLGEAKGLCPDERFVEQIEPGVCSAVLIDERHVLTAGHCVDDHTCETAAWVFGFYYDAPDHLRELTAEDVYTCEAVASQDLLLDYAVIRLDRAVAGHAPAPPAPRSDIGMSLALIGHPNGIPMKIDSGGHLTSIRAGSFASGTVDAFDGHSGAGVFSDRGELIAILQRGAEDYADDGECRRVRVLDDDSEGEQMLLVAAALRRFCGEHASSSACVALAAAEPDAGARPDAGAPADAGGAPARGGCTVALGANPVAWWLVWVLPIVVRLSRRRRRRRPAFTRAHRWPAGDAPPPRPERCPRSELGARVEGPGRLTDCARGRPRLPARVVARTSED